MDSHNVLITIMIVIVIFIIYKIIVEYNKSGMSRAIILDSIAFSLLIILYPFYLMYHYRCNLFNSFFYKMNNYEEKRMKKCIKKRE